LFIVVVSVSCVDAILTCSAAAAGAAAAAQRTSDHLVFQLHISYTQSLNVG
jgi:hypothetical protein